MPIVIFKDIKHGGILGHNKVICQRLYSVREIDKVAGNNQLAGSECVVFGCFQLYLSCVWFYFCV